MATSEQNPLSDIGESDFNKARRLRQARFDDGVLSDGKEDTPPFDASLDEVEEHTSQEDADTDALRELQYAIVRSKDLPEIAEEIQSWFFSSKISRFYIGRDIFRLLNELEEYIENNPSARLGDPEIDETVDAILRLFHLVVRDKYILGLLRGQVNTLSLRKLQERSGVVDDEEDGGMLGSLFAAGTGAAAAAAAAQAEEKAAEAQVEDMDIEGKEGVESDDAMPVLDEEGDGTFDDGEGVDVDADQVDMPDEDVADTALDIPMGDSTIDKDELEEKPISYPAHAAVRTGGSIVQPISPVPGESLRISTLPSSVQQHTPPPSSVVSDSGSEALRRAEEIYQGGRQLGEELREKYRDHPIQKRRGVRTAPRGRVRIGRPHSPARSRPGKNIGAAGSGIQSGGMEGGTDVVSPTVGTGRSTPSQTGSTERSDISPGLTGAGAPAGRSGPISGIGARSGRSQGSTDQASDDNNDQKAMPPVDERTLKNEDETMSGGGLLPHERGESDRREVGPSQFGSVPSIEKTPYGAQDLEPQTDSNLLTQPDVVESMGFGDEGADSTDGDMGAQGQEGDDQQPQEPSPREKYEKKTGVSKLDQSTKDSAMGRQLRKKRLQALKAQRAAKAMAQAAKGLEFEKIAAQAKNLYTIISGSASFTLVGIIITVVAWNIQSLFTLLRLPGYKRFGIAFPWVLIPVTVILDIVVFLILVLLLVITWAITNPTDAICTLSSYITNTDLSFISTVQQYSLTFAGWVCGT